MTEEDASSAPIPVGDPPFPPEAVPSFGGRKEERNKEGKESDENRIYEVGYLFVSTIPAEEVPREVTALKDLLEKEGASVFAEEFPKLRQLAYPMHKRSGGAYQTHASGYFGWMKFDASGEAVTRIEKSLRLFARVLRFILVKTVRESTLLLPRVPRSPRPERRDAPKDAAPPVPVSEAELEKSIEKLIAE